MLNAHGVESGSMLTGKSTHNQRVERLWRDVYEGVLSFYYDLFYYLEDQGYLDIMNDVHTIALHHVFMPKINERLEIWRQAWAKHRMRTVRSSPICLFTAGIMNTSNDSITPVTVNPENNYADIETESSENPRPVINPPALNLSEECKYNLDMECPENWTSMNFGIDVFMRAIDII